MVTDLARSKINLIGMRKLFTILSLCFAFSWGCTPSLEPQGRAISLAATLDEVAADNGLQTKANANVAAYPYTGTPSSGNELDVALWFSTDPGSYSHYPTHPTYLPCATTASYSSSTAMDIKTGTDILQYPIASAGQTAQNVYCVGFHPSSDWGNPTSTTAVTSASHAINGSDDLMFAEQMVGSYSQNFSYQTYKHLLTWVKINLSASSLAAADVWGEVKDITIVSPNSNVKIDFPESSGESTITYEGSSLDLALGLLPADKKLSITTRTFGQAFCAPPAKNSDGKLGYTIKVKTANIDEKEIFIELKKEDNSTAIPNAEYAVGKLFVINLRFNDIAVVEGVCTLKQWDDQSSDIYLEESNQNQGNNE